MRTDQVFGPDAVYSTLLQSGLCQLSLIRRDNFSPNLHSSSQTGCSRGEGFTVIDCESRDNIQPAVWLVAVLGVTEEFVNNKSSQHLLYSTR